MKITRLCSTRFTIVSLWFFCAITCYWLYFVQAPAAKLILLITAISLCGTLCFTPINYAWLFIPVSSIMLIGLYMFLPRISIPTTHLTSLSLKLPFPYFNLVYSEGITGYTSGDARVVVGPLGLVMSPYATFKEEGFITHAIRTMLSDPEPIFITSNKFSVVIPGRNENAYISNTIKYVVENTPEQHLKEIIIVDDCSDVPLKETIEAELSKKYLTKIRYFRFDTKEGLIRARIRGADEAKGDNILFLDGHCRPKKNWTLAILQNLKANPKRIVSPIIQDINNITWEDTGTFGAKMMFKWNFEFEWYDDLTNEVPLTAGGIIALTKNYWETGGKYDPDMLEWGGENFEQSFRTWLCGGDLYYESSSYVGHIFSRPPKPNPENRLVRQVQKNQKRAALVWLDDYYSHFSHIHVEARDLDVGPNLENRIQLKKELNCLPFSWYLAKFRSAFEMQTLLYKEFKSIIHVPSKLCLAEYNKKLVLTQCVENAPSQAWSTIIGNRMISNYKTEMCLTQQNRKLVLSKCKWIELFKGEKAQFWQYDYNDTERIYTSSRRYTSTLTGSDILEVSRHFIENDKTAACLTAEVSQIDSSTEQSIIGKVTLEPCRPFTENQKDNDKQTFRYYKNFELP